MPVAFTCSLSIQPSNLVLTTHSRRSSACTVPTARTVRVSSRVAAGSVRTPRRCTLAGLMVTAASAPGSSPSWTGM
jgi:hypothetical protein